mmetsp:Transcript_79667/g.221687  ORF Transcript_79667/g.221687 Transcript_79667/m.221687 type:complete len:306 (+) Transcript_79667:181-1098(+)
MHVLAISCRCRAPAWRSLQHVLGHVGTTSALPDSHWCPNAEPILPCLGRSVSFSKRGCIVQGERRTFPLPLSPARLHVRAAATKAPVEDEVQSLQARAEANVGALAGAIAHRTRKDGRVKIRSIGAKAAYRSIKAVISASDLLEQDDEASKDQVLVVRISEKAEKVTSLNGEEVNRTVMELDAHRQRRRPPPAAGAPLPRELVVSSTTNAGRAAAAVASAVRAEAGAATIRMMGATAVHQAMVATAIAQGYLDNDGRGLNFVVVPRFVDYTGVESGGSDGTKSTESAPGAKSKKQLVLGIERMSE